MKYKKTEEQQIEQLKKEQEILQKQVNLQKEKTQLQQNIKNLKKQQFENSKIGSMLNKIKSVGNELVISQKEKEIKGNPKKRNTHLFDDGSITPKNNIPWGLESEHVNKNKKNRSFF